MKRFVPETAAEIVSSPDWKLEFTAKSGLQCYVRTLTTNELALITEDHPDHESLQETSDPSQSPYLMVEIKDGSLLKELSTEQGFEVMGFIMKRDKGFQEQLKKAGTR